MQACASCVNSQDFLLPRCVRQEMEERVARLEALVAEQQRQLARAMALCNRIPSIYGSAAQDDDSLWQPPNQSLQQPQDKLSSDGFTLETRFQLYETRLHAMFLECRERAFARERAWRAETVALDMKVAHVETLVSDVLRQVEHFTRHGSPMTEPREPHRYSVADDLARLKAAICEAKPPCPSDQPGDAQMVQRHVCPSSGSQPELDVGVQRYDEGEPVLTHEARNRRMLRLPRPCQSGTDQETIAAEFKAAVAQQLGLQTSRIEVLQIEVERRDELPSDDSRSVQPS